MICMCGCGLEFEPYRTNQKFINASHCLKYNNKRRSRDRNGYRARADRVKPPVRTGNMTGNPLADMEQRRIDKQIDDRLAAGGDFGRRVSGLEFNQLAEFYQREEQRRGPARSTPPVPCYY